MQPLAKVLDLSWEVTGAEVPTSFAKRGTDLMERVGRQRVASGGCPAQILF